jgi:hypothetical protein
MLLPNNVNLEDGFELVITKRRRGFHSENLFWIAVLIFALFFLFGKNEDRTTTTEKPRITEGVRYPTSAR